MSKMFFNILLFAIEIIVAEILFTYRLKKRQCFLQRAAIWIGVTLASTVVCGFFPSEVLENAIFSSLIFLGIFLVTLFLLYFCYKESWINILFCGIAAYTTQHFAFQVSNLVTTIALGAENPILGMYSGGQMIDLFAGDLQSLFWALVYLFCFYVTYTLFYFFYAKKISQSSNLEVKNTSLLLLVVVGLLVEIVLNSVFIYATKTRTQIINITICIYNCLCCILLLSMQFGLIKTKKLENELDFTKQLMAQQAENYKANKENIDLINMKCHDMRHQIREIGKNKALSQETIAEMEKTINLYDSTVKTGNEVLDTILTAKSLSCAKNGISLSCVADGKQLSFMKDEELYSLFGNALDNAIEAVMKIERAEERIIGLNLYTVGNFIALNVYNTFAGEVEFEEGLPRTTKGDSNYHGFGIKSIKYIVEKYAGTVSVSVEEGIFDLKILFPISANK